MQYSVYYQDRQLSPIKNTLSDAEEWMAKFSCIFLNLEIRQLQTPAGIPRIPSSTVKISR